MLGKGKEGTGAKQVLPLLSFAEWAWKVMGGGEGRGGRGMRERERPSVEVLSTPLAAFLSHSTALFAG